MTRSRAPKSEFTYEQIGEAAMEFGMNGDELQRTMMIARHVAEARKEIAKHTGELEKILGESAWTLNLRDLSVTHNASGVTVFHAFPPGWITGKAKHPWNVRLRSARKVRHNAQDELLFKEFFFEDKMITRKRDYYSYGSSRTTKVLETRNKNFTLSDAMKLAKKFIKETEKVHQKA